MRSLLLLLFLSLPGLAQTSGKQKEPINPDIINKTDESDSAEDLTDEQLKDIAFEVLKRQRFPLTKEQLKELLELQKQYNEVSKREKPPKALNEIIELSTLPGADIPIIYVTTGHATSLTFIDSTGSVWPIKQVGGGNDTDFSVASVENGFNNSIEVTTEYDKGTTNANMYMEGLSGSITLKIVASLNKYHSNPIVQLDKRGPNAKTLQAYTTPEVANDYEMKKVILGLAPDETYRKVLSSDPSVEAWAKDGFVYVRTSYELQSPLPRGIQHGPNGIAAYKLAYLPALIFTDSNGVIKTVELEEMEDKDEY